MMIKDRGKTNICWYIPLLTKSSGCSRGRNPCGIRGYFPFVRILQCFFFFFFLNNDNNNDSGGSNYLAREFIQSEVIGMLEQMTRTMSEEMFVNPNEKKENDSDYCVRVFLFIFFVSGQIFWVAVLFCLNA